MDIRVLNYFVTIVQQRSISRAAESLHMTQPTLSRQIKDLEEELDTRLLIRGSREIQVTEDGQYLYNRAIEILDLVNKTEQTIKTKDEISGDLYIGAAETQSLDTIAKVTKVLISDYQSVKVNFRSGNADDIFEKLDAGTLDLGVILGQIDDKKYNSLSLPIRDRWGVLVPIQHPLANRKSIKFREIMEYPLLVSAQSSLPQDAFAGLGDYQIVGTYNLLYNASLLVEAGVGIALCLDGIINNPNLTFVELEKDSKQEFYLVWKRHTELSPLAKEFIGLVKREIE